MKNQNILEKLYIHFNEKGFCVSLDDDTLYVHHSMAMLFFEKDRLNLSFEVCCEPTSAAVITQDVISMASTYKRNVDIFETYAFVADKEGVIQTILFGEEAVYYYETGEILATEEENKAQEPETDDPQKKADALLDQIHTKGIKSLNKEQKEFLENFSKGKTKH